VNLADWLRAELEQSAAFASRLALRREQLDAPRRSAGAASAAPHTYGSYASLDAMHQAVGSARDNRDRAFAWSDDRVADHPRSTAPSEPLEPLRRVAAGVQADAHRFLGATAAAEELYGHVRGEVPLASVIPPEYASRPAPTGARASSAAAHLSGADHLSRSARSKAWHDVLGGAAGRALPAAPALIDLDDKRP
jgi:hypothetical protein